MQPELKVVLVGSKTSYKYLVGNIILGKKVFSAADATFDCERREGEACGRRVTVVKAPGWLRGYHLGDTPELVRTEAILGVSLCPPGLHACILVINAEKPFKDIHKRATQEHLRHFFGERVWDHTIVVFNHRGLLGHKTIEEYVREEGVPLRSLLEACGGRYHLLCDDGTGHDAKVEELFAKIDGMVADSGCYESEGTLVQSVKEKREEVDKNAEELRRQSRDQRETLRNLLTGPKHSLRILMVGWVFSGKSATGNRLLKVKAFPSCERTLTAIKRSGVVAGRQLIITDTPGWWKFFQAIFNPTALKSEILAGVSLCSPSPNVILLAVPLDTSFTDEQKSVTEENVRLLGPRAWRHMMVLFTFGDTLGNKAIEQHIESEGAPLRWLIEKCGKRYHVLDNTSDAEGQVTELLEKMEEMVAGNGSFYLGETRDPAEERSDRSAGSNEESAAREISGHLGVEWNRMNWSMDSPLNFSEASKRSEASASRRAEMEQRQGEGQLDTILEGEGEDDAESGSLKIVKGLLEREWSRREASMELYYERAAAKEGASEPDPYQQQKSREKVLLWLKTQHPTSGFKADTKKRWKRRPVLEPKRRTKKKQQPNNGPETRH